MARIMIEVTNNMSKQEEIDLLDKIGVHVHSENTYLADLFSYALFTWASEQIRNDFPPDVMDYYKKTLAELTEAQGVIVNLQRQIESMSIQLNDREAANERIKGYNTDHLKTIEQLNRKIQSLETEIEVQTLAAESIRLAGNRCIAAREQTIIELKARLFDLLDRPQDLSGLDQN